MTPEITAADREARDIASHVAKIAGFDEDEGCLEALCQAAEAGIEAERDAVAAWLRRLASQSRTPEILAFWGDPFKRDGQLLCGELADAIERGEHLKDKSDG